MFTPWGRADTERMIAPGIVEVTTASHGGIHLVPDLNGKVNAVWRDKAGWYEEDCDWAIVAVTFPEHFRDKKIEDGPEVGLTHEQYAHNVLKRWYPDEYGTVFGVTVTAAESNIVAEREFKAAHADRWLSTSAWGHRNDRNGRLRVPAGWVGVCASVGGSRAHGSEERWFLVPEAEYDVRNTLGGVVIDPDRHPSWPEVVDEEDGPVTVFVGGAEDNDRNAVNVWAVIGGMRLAGKLWRYPATDKTPERWQAYREGFGAVRGTQPTQEEALHAVGFRLAPFAEVTA